MEATDAAIKLVRPLRRESTIGQILQKLEQKVQTPVPKSYVKVINVENDMVIKYPLPAPAAFSDEPQDVTFVVPPESPHSIEMHFITSMQCPHCQAKIPLTYELTE